MRVELYGHSFSEVVLIADLKEESKTVELSKRRDLEKSEFATVELLLGAIHALGYKTQHYETPDELANNAPTHRDDLILSIYGGEESRNRMALVPAICETFGLKFIGPDVYGRVIAQDKEISKRLAVDAGLRTPNWIILRSIDEMDNLSSFSYPCVVKPLLEGSSIGISQSSLCTSYEQAKALALSLFSDLNQPIMAEEFIPGRETALSVIETESGYKWAYSEIFIPSDPNHFQSRLFDADEKSNPTKGRTVRNIDGELCQDDLNRILALLSSFGPFGYCRVDGRHHNGKFYFLEITPDAWINPKGQFAKAFTEQGMSYQEVIKAVLFSAMTDLPDR